MRDQHLTRCELEAMNVVWKASCVTVQDVCDAIDRDLAYTTVMTTMKILEEKGAVARCGKQGRAYLYKPLVTRQQVRRRIAGDLTEQLFDGSAKTLMLSLFDAGSLSSDEISELRQAIKVLENNQ